MTAAEKIKAWLDENRMSQADLCKVASVPTSNMSNMMRGQRKVNLDVGVRVSRVMNVLLDDLMNDDLDWPLPKASDRPKPLTAAEQRVILLAHEVCRDDHRPAELDTARKLLTGRLAPPLGPARPLPPAPTPEPPDTGEAPRRGRR